MLFGLKKGSRGCAKKKTFQNYVVDSATILQIPNQYSDEMCRKYRAMLKNVPPLYLIYN